MATKKKRRSSSKKNAKQQTIQRNRQLQAILCFALAVFLLFVVLIPGENLWTTLLHNPMFSLFGITAYFYPFLIGAISILLAKESQSTNTSVRIFECVVLVLLIGTFISTCSIDGAQLKSGDLTFATALSNAWNFTNKFSGGVLGTLIAFPICLAVGKVCAIITLIILIFAFVMIITGTQLLPLFKAISKPAKMVSEQANNAFRERTIKEENRQEKQKELKIIKGFDVDMEVDEPERTKKRKPTLDEIGQKLVSTYNGEEIPTPTDEDEYVPVDDIDVDEAIAAAR